MDSWKKSNTLLQCLLFALFLGLAIHKPLSAQNNVGIGTTNPNNKALLDLSVPQPTTEPLGLLLPRLTTTQRVTTLNPGSSEEGMLVYDTNLDSAFLWNGTDWQVLGGSAFLASSNTYTNGLEETAGTVRWGGDLTQSTTLTQDGSEALSFTNAGAGVTEVNLTGTGSFFVQDNGNAAFAVEDDGQVGIGTNFPNVRLHVLNPMGNPDQLHALLENNEPGQQSALSFFTETGGRDASIFLAENNAQTLGFALGEVGNATERNNNAQLLLTQDGRLRIGSNANPDSALDVSGGARISGLSGTGTRFVVAGPDGSLSDSISTIPGDNLGNHAAAQNIELRSNYLSNDGDSEGLTVDNNGAVGINTNSPTDTLTVNGSTGTGSINLGVINHTGPAPISDLDVANKGVVFIESSGGSDTQVLSLSGGTAGQILHFVVKGPKDVDVIDESAGGTQQFQLGSNGSESFSPGAGFSAVCDGTFWYLTTAN